MNRPILFSRLIRLTAGLTVLLSAPGTLAQTVNSPQIEAFRHNIETAVCLNEWDLAMDLTTQLMGLADVDARYRTELVRFRGQIQTWANQGQPIRFQGCDDEVATSMVILGNPDLHADTEANATPGPPLDWARAYDSLQEAESSSFSNFSNVGPPPAESEWIQDDF